MRSLHFGAVHVLTEGEELNKRPRDRKRSPSYTAALEGMLLPPAGTTPNLEAPERLPVLK